MRVFQMFAVKAAALPVVLAGALALGSVSSASAEDAPSSANGAKTPEIASLPVMQVGRAELPKVLSATDAERYRRIFDLQKAGDWLKADHEIKQLEDRVLMGHVMAQRYLHPTKYRSKYKELKDWLADYNDHHYARQIYKLALRRRPANWKYPEKPASGRALYEQPAEYQQASPPTKNLTRAQRQRAYQLKVQIKSHLRRGHTLSAKRIVKSAEAERLFSAYDMDWARERLARGYFQDGRDDWAVQWSEMAAARSGKYLPQAYWTAGLAQWRLGNVGRAAEHFEKAAEFDPAPWTHASSAFWAARAHLIARRPERVMPLLEEAAKFPRTFYGMLANKLLGREPNFDWRLPPMDGDDVKRLLSTDGGRRALALLQVGEDERAEKELRQVARLSPRDQAAGILAIAAQAGMAELTMRLHAMLYPNGEGMDGAAYPLPAWQPADGFKVDRALIYALVRQESRFNPNAKSYAGARGLMQLMPGTASFVARDRALRWSKRSHLFDPELNLKLGQRYISMLLENDKINGDLFLMAAAWNGGPGNLNKWRRRVDDLDDPLFFIESLPSRETRIFIERVLTNLWIYRHRLGQPAPSLDAVASGVWPSYQSVGQEPQRVAVNVPY